MSKPIKKLKRLPRYCEKGEVIRPTQVGRRTCGRAVTWVRKHEETLTDDELDLIKRQRRLEHDIQSLKSLISHTPVRRRRAQ